MGSARPAARAEDEDGDVTQIKRLHVNLASHPLTPTAHRADRSRRCSSTLPTGRCRRRVLPGATVCTVCASAEPDIGGRTGGHIGHGRTIPDPHNHLEKSLPGIFQVTLPSTMDGDRR
jgi:hypothetical protein